jgi:hypothetical protein
MTDLKEKSLDELKAEVARRETLEAAQDAAWHLKIAQDAYEGATVHLEHSLDVLPPDEFWPLVHAYRMEVFQAKRNGRDSKHAADCFRCHMHGDENVGLLLLRMSKTWSETRRPLYKALDKITSGRGDDSYGDLLDSMPYAGRDVYEKILSGHFANEGEIREAVREALREPVRESMVSRWQPNVTDEKIEAGIDSAIKLIFSGENYNSMFLANEGKRAFVYDVAQERSPEQYCGWTSEVKLPRIKLEEQEQPSEGDGK